MPRDAMRLHLGWVASMEAGPEGDVHFALDDGTACRIAREAASFEFWTRLVARSRDYGWPVYVRRDPQGGRVDLLLHASVHTVDGVQPDPEDAERLRVWLGQSDAIHMLRASEVELANRLRLAAASGQRVVITRDARASEIIDVRFAPEVPLAAGA